MASGAAHGHAPGLPANPFLELVIHHLGHQHLALLQNLSTVNLPTEFLYFG